jgi:hypothetical protein
MLRLMARGKAISSAQSAPSDHFRRGAPVRPLLFLGHPLDAQPLETDASTPMP